MTYNAEHKQVYFKAYMQLSSLEQALKNITEEEAKKFQITILGKVAKFYLDTNNEVSKNTDALKLHWQQIFGNNIDCGSFNNPEIGDIFIVGALASTFLYELDGKTLGMLSSGPYGILRGIGASESQATTYLKILNNNSYLLIFRGTEADLANYRRLLTEKEKG